MMAEYAWPQPPAWRCESWVTLRLLEG
jgi:hypothetical protein